MPVTRGFVVVLLSFATLGTLVGCGKKTETKLPESGSIQQFLDENPDYKEASDLEPASSDDEFGAADGE